MMNHKQELIVHKNIRRGIIETKPVPFNKTKKCNIQWLTVFLDNNTGRWLVWNSYSDLTNAIKQMVKMQCYWPLYLIEKPVYEKHYKHLHL